MSITGSKMYNWEINEGEKNPKNREDMLGI